MTSPYEVWLSEIMLQQTVVATVIPYYKHFLKCWPKIEDLAAAHLDQVLHAWQGLGYYARARNLHKCAQLIANKYDGTFPNTETELIALPGIGPYTAAAIAAMAFGKKASPVDANIERVLSRLYAVTETLPKAKPELRRLAIYSTPNNRSGDHAQALMDLGATICIPKGPKCYRCPLKQLCLGHKKGISDSLPRRLPKIERPVRHGVAFCLFNESGHLLLRRRPEKGLLGGMIEVPSTPWQSVRLSINEATMLAPMATSWQVVPGKIFHIFTHFRLELIVLIGTGSRPAEKSELWHSPNDLNDLATPSVIKKIIKHSQTKFRNRILI